MYKNPLIGFVVHITGMYKNPLIGFVVHITGMYKNQVFQDADVSFIVGEGSEAGIVNGIERAIRSFRKDEKSRLNVASKYAFGSTGNPEYNIPSDAAVIYEVELEDFTRVSFTFLLDEYQFNSVMLCTQEYR